MIPLSGTCLCGAVRIRAEVDEIDISACHCGRCRRWSGAAFWCFAVPADAVTVEGTPATWRSSAFAERAWCSTCGTHLWLKDDDGPYEFVPALFEAAGGVPLAREVYADRALACVRLAGDHPRVSRAAYERENRHEAGEAP